MISQRSFSPMTGTLQAVLSKVQFLLQWTLFPGVIGVSLNVEQLIPGTDALPSPLAAPRSHCSLSAAFTTPSPQWRPGNEGDGSVASKAFGFQRAFSVMTFAKRTAGHMLGAAGFCCPFRS